jgi:ATP-dependent Clp protease adaptor protein ClpS
MADQRLQPGTDTEDRTRTDLERARLFRVILHNDDYTTMEFVVRILESVFLKQPAEAYRIMMLVHTRGWGSCGVYPFEIAETKVATVHDRAREQGFPLRASLEPE